MITLHSLKIRQTLAGVARWIEHRPVRQRVAGSIPSQGTCLGCRPGPRWGACERQPHIDVSLPLFLPPFLSLFKHKKIKSLKKAGKHWFNVWADVHSIVLMKSVVTTQLWKDVPPVYWDGVCVCVCVVVFVPEWTKGRVRRVQYDPLAPTSCASRMAFLSNKVSSHTWSKAIPAHPIP